MEEEEMIQVPQETEDQLLEPMEDQMLQQQIKVILLKQRNEYLIGAVTELDEEPSILIENCYEILDDETISPFPAFTQQRDVFLTGDTILSILDPSPNLVEIYKSK